MTTGAIGGDDAVSDRETQDWVPSEGNPVRGTPLHFRKILLPMWFLGHI